MTTKNIKKEIVILTREIKALRSLLSNIFSDGDSEGEYKDKFVEEILKAKEEKGKYIFTNGKDFLRLLRQK